MDETTGGLTGRLHAAGLDCTGPGHAARDHGTSPPRGARASFLPWHQFLISATHHFLPPPPLPTVAPTHVPTVHFLPVGTHGAAAARRRPRASAACQSTRGPPRRWLACSVSKTSSSPRAPPATRAPRSAPPLPPAGARRGRCAALARPRAVGVRDAACPLSTRGGTRLVRLVRRRGGGGRCVCRRAEPMPSPWADSSAQD